MQPNALLIQQNFIVVKSECYTFFLGSTGIRPNLSVTCERLTCIDRVRYVWAGTIRGLSVGYVWHVGRVFPYGVYIDSNHRDSRI
jgi:hypothetical protein